jgi:Asp-tRNA(Asn)/Glu-tRNA(Gln) amidotransferase A subunit family amidase
MPACALPIGLGNEQLPVSMQIAGPLAHDAQVLNVAELIETLVDWQHPFLNAAVAQIEPTKLSMNEEICHVAE